MTSLTSYDEELTAEALLCAQFNSASLNRHLSQAYNANVGGYSSRGFVEVRPHGGHLRSRGPYY